MRRNPIQAILVAVITVSAAVLLSQSVVAAKNSNNPHGTPPGQNQNNDNHDSNKGKPDNEKDKGTRPGNGHGDDNHKHTGPPGQSVRAHHDD